VRASLAAFAARTAPSILRSATGGTFDVADFGAVGDGAALDTAAIQAAIDRAAAAGGGARVLLRGGRRYLVGTLVLKGGIEFHLADDAEIVASARPGDYTGPAAITADGAEGLTISGSGSINGRSPEFMVRYDPIDEWWRPRPFRPRLVALTGCRRLDIRDITLKQAASWTLHLLGCEDARVSRIRIRNQLDVPNCDGIDPDHCRNLEISDCDIECGDDAIVVKTTRAGAAFGPSSNIRVRDCTIRTQDSGVKIGTETTQDISSVRFERCTILSSCRGICIQLRDEGNISDVAFSDIRFVSRYFSAPWWGRGEAVSLTAIPRAPGAKLGILSGVRIARVSGRAENSLRLSGSPESRLRDIRLDDVAIEFDRWTKYPGGVWDNRPTTAEPGIEPHGTPGFAVRHADQVVLSQCKVEWGAHAPDSFTHALEAQDVTGLLYPGFSGTAAHPGRDPAVAIS
jgi:hypothetical protein